MTETRTMTLAEFLLARIAEDMPGRGQHWTKCEAPDGGPCTCAGNLRQQNERRRVECEAKRRIVELHEPSEDADYCTTCDLLWANEGQGPHGWPCETLRLLVLPYAEHPDYREEWRA